MTLEEYVDNLNDFLEQNPEAKELPVVYASDPEANDWHYVHSTPCLIDKDDVGRRLTTYTVKKAVEVCIN